MTFSLAVSFAASLLIPITASAQMVVPEPQAQEAVPSILALTASSRVGISTEGMNDRNRASQDTAGKRSTARTRARHALVGGTVGVFAGGVIGAAIGGYVDAHNHDDSMIPGYAIVGVLGAGVGLLLGLIVGADWPVS